MRAVLIEGATGAATLRMGEVQRPALGPTDVRIAVRATSVNRADLLIRAGTHVDDSRPAGPAIAGGDAAGEVVEVGTDVGGVAPGDRVMVMVTGGLAEEVVVPAAMALPIPATWSYGEGAAAVVGLLNEHNALVTAGRTAPGETVLVHAVTAGVGTQAVQVARYLGAGRIFGTSRSAAKTAQLGTLGLDELIDTSERDFAERILEATGGLGVDVVIDHVGGPYLAANLRAAAIGARIVGVGRLGGAEGVLDLEELARKRVELIGVTFRTRSPAEHAAVVAALRADVDLDAAADSLRPIVDRTLNWTRALEAQTDLGRDTHVGKIVLEVD